MNEFWLTLRGAKFDFGGRPILDDVSLDLCAPRFVTLSGPSGSGKSTFLRLLAGHYRLRSGELLLHGKRVDRPSPERSLVFQDYKLFPWKSVYENVAAGLRFARHPAARIDAMVSSLLEHAGLSDNRDDWPSQLSGGMRQRVAILRALAVEPKYLLLDEPFSALDADNVGRMLNLVWDYLDRSGAACVLATHEQRHGSGRPGHRLRLVGNGQVEIARCEKRSLRDDEQVRYAQHRGSART
jgi:sulfonate transport system ATP-binding protein